MKNFKKCYKVHTIDQIHLYSSVSLQLGTSIFFLNIQEKLLGLSIHNKWEKNTLITVSNNHPVSLNEEEMQRGGGEEEVSKAGSYVHLANMPMIESLGSQCGRALHKEIILIILMG